MGNAVIELQGLTRYFGATCAVRDVTLSVPSGCVIGFLGRNGSGKTTTLRMLLGLLTPTRGSATLLGYPSEDLPPEARARVGYLSEGHPVYGWMRISAVAAFQARFYPKWSQDVFRRVIDHFQLSPKAFAGKLSRGQRAGLALALTLATEPDLLILDDPALGLDPVARSLLLEAMIHFTRKEGRTILFSSHLLSDVERVADRIAVLDSQVLRADCSLEAFREHVRQFALYFPATEKTSSGTSTALSPLPQVPGLLAATREEGHVLVTLVQRNGNALKALEAFGAERIEEVPLGLEDAFIRYLAKRGGTGSFLEVSGGES